LPPVWRGHPDPADSGLAALSLILFMFFREPVPNGTFGASLCDICHRKSGEDEQKVANETISRNWRNHSETDGA
jgi:hypothetical protein